MAHTLRMEDRLEGASNFVSWKIRINTLMQELELESYIEEEPKIPEDETEKAIWKRRNNKAKKLIIDSVKDSILPSISRLTSAYEVYKTIQNTFEINTASRILTLKQQMMNIKMNKGETITSYFLRITEIRDQLFSIGNTVDDVDLSLIALRGLPLSWESFIQCISGRPPLPKFYQTQK